MKGQITVKLEGKDVQLKFTLGVLEDFQEYCEKNELNQDEALQSMKHLRQFLHFMTVYAGNEVDAEAFKMLDIDQVSSFNSLIEKATGELGNVGKAKGKK